MKYKDTILKEIKWHNTSTVQTDDGKMDLTLHIPLTDIMDAQAKNSFAKGVQEGAQFILDELAKGDKNWKPEVMKRALALKMKEWQIN
jgi:hypothetical protein